MSAPDDRELEAAARSALEAMEPAPAADPTFRARLRADFATGMLAGAAVPRTPVVLPLPRRRAVKWLPALAAAAAAVLVVTAINGNEAPRWHVVHASASGVATVDGREIPVADAPRLDAALHPGARVQLSPDAMLEVASARTLALQMAGGTDAILPRAPGRWWSRESRGTIAAGEWRITTGAAFAGARFEVGTPSAHVEVTGTTLAVICQPQGTCVCVYEGHVRVGHDPTDMVTVMHGRRRYMYADRAHAPLDDAMLPPEVPALGGFCEAMRPLLKRPR
jgi:ferric-dicitrate binding protein FerR (iron transport regulator)